MVITTLSLLTSAFSVYFDTRADGVAVPAWVKVVFFKHLARLFCLRHSVEAVLGDEFDDVKVSPVAEKRQRVDASDVVTVESLEDGKCTTKAPTMQRRRADTTEELLLKELRKITASLAESVKAERRHQEWQLLAKVIDRGLFWLCLCVSTGYLIHLIDVIIKQ